MPKDFDRCVTSTGHKAYGHSMEVNIDSDSDSDSDPRSESDVYPLPPLDMTDTTSEKK